MGDELLVTFCNFCMLVHVCVYMHVVVFIYLYFVLSLATQFPTVSGDYICIHICAGLFA